MGELQAGHVVMGPGFVWMSPAIMSSCGSEGAGVKARSLMKKGTSLWVTILFWRLRAAARQLRRVDVAERAGLSAAVWWLFATQSDRGEAAETGDYHRCS